VRRALAWLKARSSSGLDRWTPKQLLHLDDDGLECLVDVIMLIERQCTWPFLMTKVVFLAKRTKGVRPIALVYLVARAQAKLRKYLAFAGRRAMFGRAGERPKASLSSKRSGNKLRGASMSRANKPPTG
jgi:hypothetical protein